MAKVLLVDDDLEILKLCTILISQMGHECTTCENPLSAIELLNESEFNILISDATMPEFSGFDLLRAIKKNPKHHELVKAMLTARREPEDVELAAQLGVKDYIIKPIEPAIFMDKIERLVKLIPTTKNYKVEILRTTFNWSIEIKFELMKISEFGLTCLSSHKLPTGFEFSMTPPAKSPDQEFQIPLKVLSCQKTESSYQLTTVFLDLPESERLMIQNSLKPFIKAS